MVRYIFFTIYITIRNIASTVKKILGDSNFKTEYKSLKYHFSFTLSGLIATLTKGSIAVTPNSSNKAPIHIIIDITTIFIF